MQNGRNGRGRVGKGVESAIGWGRVETGGMVEKGRVGNDRKGWGRVGTGEGKGRVGKGMSGRKGWGMPGKSWERLGTGGDW